MRLCFLLLTATSFLVNKDEYIPGRVYGAPPQTPLLRAPVLRAYRASLGAFGPSIVAPQPEILDPPLGTPTL